jgi:uncharacterized protein YdaU (DUF1376 family)
MGKAPAFQFYAAEYLADENVQLLSLEQEGIYIRLLAYCWREGSIQAEPEKLARLCKGCSVGPLTDVLALFRSSGVHGRLSHGRLDEERIKHESYRLKQAMNGARGGRPLKQNPDENQTKGLGLLGESQRKTKKRSSSAIASSSSTEGKKQNHSRVKREPDSRYIEFREFTRIYWTQSNPQIALPWGAGEVKQLNSLLSANPSLDGAAFKDLLEQRAKSRVNHAERPRVWLARATDYAGGPLNEFNRPMRGEKNRGAHHRIANPSADRETTNFDEIEAAFRNLDPREGSIEE